MAKEVTATVKLQCPAGAATPAPPVGPALGQHGINIGQFVKQFNDATRAQAGLIIPVVISVYKDRSFSLEFKSPPAAVLLKKAAKVPKGHGMPAVKGKKGQYTYNFVGEVKRDRSLGAALLSMKMTL
mgnify:CR=1 FL=1